MARISAEQALQIALSFDHAGQFAVSEGWYRRILEAQPDHAEALHRLGAIELSTGRYGEASGHIAQAIAKCPVEPAYYSNLGEAYRRLGRFEDAVAQFQQALALNPDFADAHLNLGGALADLGRFDEAILSCRQALALRPEWPLAQNNLGRSISGKGQPLQATHWYLRSLEGEPANPEAHNNLGNAYAQLGQWNEAIASFRRAIALEPRHVGAHWNLSQALLTVGRYGEGWPEYEWRIPFLRSRPNRCGARWNGGRVDGQSLLLHSEQGCGDTLQFLRYVPLALARAGALRLALECQTELTRLVAGTFGPDVEVIAEKDFGRTISVECDHHLSLLSLPLVLGKFSPWHPATPYLCADRNLRAAWRERLNCGSRLRVGLAWAGNPGHVHDSRRSLHSESLLPIMRVPGVDFYNLQVDPHGEPIQLKSAGLIDFTRQLSDFAETAALVATLDLVISVDTAVVHLAGALGCPVWTLLPFAPDWRWGLNGQDTPWYPTMRLFRQSAAGDWDSSIQRVAEELRRIKRPLLRGPEDSDRI